jgi:DNA-binding transcriptional ArsR family regulator
MEIEEIKKAASKVVRAIDILSEQRIVILLLLKERDCSVGELIKATASSQPNTSHHLRFLRAAEVVEFRRQGKGRTYTLTATGVKVVNLLKTFCKP